MTDHVFASTRKAKVSDLALSIGAQTVSSVTRRDLALLSVCDGMRLAALRRIEFRHRAITFALVERVARAREELRLDGGHDVLCPATSPGGAEPCLCAGGRYIEGGGGWRRFTPREVGAFVSAMMQQHPSATEVLAASAGARRWAILERGAVTGIASDEMRALDRHIVGGLPGV